MRHYVYALVDPEHGVRYIGTGSMQRTEAHFRDLGRLPEDRPNRVVGVRTEDIWANDRDEESAPSKIAWLSDLEMQGKGHADIARIVARQLEESAAFAIESFLIRSVYGLARDAVGPLLNANHGHHPERFRPKGCWAPIRGLDLFDERGNPSRDELHPHYVYVLRDPNVEPPRDSWRPVGVSQADGADSAS